MELRRRTPRISTTEWSGKYTIEDDPNSGWEECRVLDISLLGVGLELLGPVNADILMGRRLVIQVHPPLGASVSLRLVAQVRNVGDGQSGGVRAGLEFTDISETERDIIRVMELLKVAW